MNELQRYLDRQPHGFRTAFAKRLGITRQYLAQLEQRVDGREPSPRLAVLIERESGMAVRRWSMRPQDWHQVWPDLIGAAGAPALAGAGAHLDAVCNACGGGVRAAGDEIHATRVGCN